jgi:hypothetical protein
MTKKSKSKKTEVEEDIEEDVLSDLEVSESVDSIDDMEDKIKIEKEIKGEVKRKKYDEEMIEEVDDVMREDKPKKEKTLKATKKPKKQDMIDKILEAYDKLNLPEVDRMTPSALKATKLNILEQKLGQVSDKIAKEILKIDNIKITPGDVPQEIQISDDAAVIALYNVNMVLTNFVENLAEMGRENETIGEYVPNIKGLTKRLFQEEKSKQLKLLLKDIIAKYGNQIKPYMDPLLIWAGFMISTATEQVALNKLNIVDKKKIQSLTDITE